MQFPMSVGVPSLSFMQGFVVGQAVLLALFLALFRYLFIARTPESLARERAGLLERTRALQASLDARSKARPGTRVPYEQGAEAVVEDLLAQTGYELGGALPESLDWLSVLVAQLVLQYRQNVLSAAARLPEMDVPPTAHEVPLPALQTSEQTAAKCVLERVLNRAIAGRTMDIVDVVTVTDIDMGRRYPLFSHARVLPSARGTCLRVEVDVEYTDVLSLGLDTRLWLHVPQRRFASLAVALCLRVERFVGRLAVEIDTREDEGSGARPVEARVSLSPDYVLDMHVSTVLGSQSRLYDIPKVEELLLGRIRGALHDALVAPNAWHVTLPSLHD